MDDGDLLRGEGVFRNRCYDNVTLLLRCTARFGYDVFDRMVRFCQNLVW